jgi:WD40 repeat protein
LARLDQLLVDSETDRWVVITGGPGMGKSALLAAWLARREATGAVVPHHFIRRGAYDWDDPAKLVGSLVAQLEDGFPDLHEPDGDERMHPATRLARALSRVSEHVLRPRGERLVVLIDGLDEYDPPAGQFVGDPLAAFLPDALPAGVRLLCASRPRHPYVSSLEARDGELVQINLDSPDCAADNDATVRAFWEGSAESLSLDTNFIDEAVSRARGNVQHAVQLRKHLAVLPPEQRRVEDIPHGLAALIEKSWERVAVDTVVVDGLGILCAAQEALTLDELGAVASWTGGAQRRAFLRAAKELLVETLRRGGQPEYRLHHDSIRGHIARSIGEAALRAHHAALAQRHATWPAPEPPERRRYALRYALIHRTEAGDLTDAWRIAADTSFLEAKCRELGVHETEADVARVAEQCRVSHDAVLARRFGDLARALARESHWLRVAPEVTAALLWNRLRRWGWSADDIDEQLRHPIETRFLRARRTEFRDNPALIRNLVGHSDYVNACVITADGRLVVSASSDKTLKVWDLDTGRTLITLDGHTRSVNACVVTPDNRHVVSASDDGTLKVWDLESGRMLATLKGHTSRATACAVAADGRSVVSGAEDGTLKLWDLASERLLATLHGHIGRVNACTLTADSRCVISALDDGTLRLWSVPTGSELATLEGHTSRVNACVSTMDGRCVISASDDKTLKLWDVATGCLLATLKGHTGCVNACAVTADGRRMVSASNDGTLRVWNLESRQGLGRLVGHAGYVNACALTADGRRMVSASHRTLKIWDLENEKTIRLSSLMSLSHPLSACAVTRDGCRAILASVPNVPLKVLDTEDGRTIATLEGHTDRVSACTVTPDGQRVISASHDRTLKVWNVASGCALATLEGHTASVTACAVTADGRRVVSASSDETLKIWDLASGCTLATLEGHTAGVTACAVVADGRYVVSASHDRTLRVWDLENPRAPITLEGHTDTVWACAVTADGQRVISASEDGTLKVWDLNEGRTLATLEGHNGGVRACAVTADGRWVVSASYDWTLRVWDLESYACLLIHRGDGHYSVLAVSATVIVAGDSAGGVWFLDWPASNHAVKQIGNSADSHRGSLSSYKSTPSRSQTKKHTILFMAANPLGTDRLALDEEARAIQAELERSGQRDQFELVTRWAARPLDILRELRRLKPTVVHFSGHGGPRSLRTPRPAGGRHVFLASAPSGGEPHGLYFHDAAGGMQIVSTEAIAQMFAVAGASVKLVVLNACFTEPIAEALLAHVDCVVGMSGSIHDDAARGFAIGFYGGLGERESIAAAFRQGCVAISLEGLRDSDRPQLRLRDGIDAKQLILAADPG